MTNREIAGALYMSPRSVESHLTSIYRRFGVRSRAQLIAALSQTNPRVEGHAAEARR
jgi:DNA-binding CsgD family transcriptional regulator